MKICEKKEKMIKKVQKLNRKMERTEDEIEKKNIEEETCKIRKKINDIVDEQRTHSGLSSADMINKIPYC